MKFNKHNGDMGMGHNGLNGEEGVVVANETQGRPLTIEWGGKQFCIHWGDKTLSTHSVHFTQYLVGLY